MKIRDLLRKLPSGPGNGKGSPLKLRRAWTRKEKMQGYLIKKLQDDIEMKELHTKELEDQNEKLWKLLREAAKEAHCRGS